MPARAEVVETTLGHIELELGSGNGECVIRPVGELDLSTLPPFETTVRYAVNSRPDFVVFDLSELDFLAVCAVGVVERAESTVREYGGSVVVREPAPVVRRVLDFAHVAIEG